jgi:hypothetical protein
MLCVFGLIASLGAFLGLFVFVHAPPPWGGGPGGLSGVMNDATWDITVILSLVDVGLAGLLFLVVGCVSYVVSKWRPRTVPNQCPVS